MSDGAGISFRVAVPTASVEDSAGILPAACRDKRHVSLLQAFKKVKARALHYLHQGDWELLWDLRAQ